MFLGVPVLVATLATWLRAALRPEDRGAWIALSVGLTANAAGGVYLGTQDAPFPSAADACFLAFFPATFLAALLFAKARLARFTAALWLDAAIGALGAAAVVTQLLAVTVQDAVGGNFATMLGLAFPMGDALLLVMVVVALTLRGGKVNAVWMLLGIAMLGRVVIDAAHILTTLEGERQPLWVPLASVFTQGCIALAAWQPYTPPRKVTLDGWRTLVTPSLLALVAGGLLVADHFHHTTDAAVWLSAATLVVVLIRMALTFIENTALHATRTLALTDELTGLANRRHFDEALSAALEQGDGPLAVAMVDLDRFKELNDTLGHHGRRRLLAQLGPRLRSAIGEHGLVARLGGDEFALLLPGAGLARATERRPPARRRAPGAVRDRRARGRDGRERRRRARARARHRRQRRCCSTPTSRCTRPRRRAPASRPTTPRATATRASGSP